MQQEKSSEYKSITVCFLRQKTKIVFLFFKLNFPVDSLIMFSLEALCHETKAFFYFCSNIYIKLQYEISNEMNNYEKLQWQVQ